jgi:hypothetical protein
MRTFRVPGSRFKVMGSRATTLNSEPATLNGSRGVPAPCEVCSSVMTSIPIAEFGLASVKANVILSNFEQHLICERVQ